MPCNFNSNDGYIGTSSGSNVNSVLKIKNCILADDKPELSRRRKNQFAKYHNSMLCLTKRLYDSFNIFQRFTISDIYNALSNFTVNYTDKDIEYMCIQMRLYDCIDYNNINQTYGFIDDAFFIMKYRSE